MDVFLSVDPHFLEVALEACGPLERYLAEAGVSPAVLARAREALLEPVAAA